MEQRTTERTADTVERLVYVDVHDTIRETVHDTVRETVTVQLNAQGDTTRKDTEREHVSDRTRERASTSQQTEASTSRHEEESSKDEKQTVIEQPKAKNRWGAFWWGFGVGSVISLAIGLIGVVRIFRKYKI